MTALQMFLADAEPEKLMQTSQDAETFDLNGDAEISSLVMQ